MGRQRRQIWFKRPRVNPNSAWMEQNEGLTCALLVVPGTYSIQLNIVCHKDSFRVDEMQRGRYTNEDEESAGRPDDRPADPSSFSLLLPHAHHVVSGMGASRNAVIIEANHSARSVSVTCVVPGSTASWERGRPTRSPTTPPPSRRNISTTCSGRTISESPMMSRVGALTEAMASRGQPRVARSRSTIFATSRCQFSGCGAMLAYSCWNGEPSRSSGFMALLDATSSG